MDLFAQTDYKQFLDYKVRENADQRGYQSRLAAAAGCQRSYLSQVIKGSIHFTPEHALGAAVFWGLTELETDCFCELVNLERCSSPQLRKRILQKLNDLRAKKDSLDASLSGNSRVHQSTDELNYFAAWYTSAIHVALNIPNLKSPDALARHFQLPTATVREVLQNLEKMGLVKNKQNSDIQGSSHLHMSKKSPIIGMHHSNWRQKAILDSTHSASDGLHFTSLQTHSESDFLRLKSLIKEMVENSRSLIEKSPDEALTCFTIDLFKV